MKRPTPVPVPPFAHQSAAPREAEYGARPADNPRERRLAGYLPWLLFTHRTLHDWWVAGPPQEDA